LENTLGVGLAFEALGLGGWFELKDGAGDAYPVLGWGVDVFDIRVGGNWEGFWKN
jgi:hypothetical protein